MQGLPLCTISTVAPPRNAKLLKAMHLLGPTRDLANIGTLARRQQIQGDQFVHGSRSFVPW